MMKPCKLKICQKIFRISPGRKNVEGHLLRWAFCWDPRSRVTAQYTEIRIKRKTSKPHF